MVGESSVPEQQSLQILELVDGEVSSKGGLHAFLSYYSDSHVSSLDHAHVVSSITDSQHSFTQLPAILDTFSECFLLTGRASTANDGGHFEGGFEEILGDFLILEHEGQTLPINDENLAEILLDDRSLLIPLILINHLLYFDI